MTAITSHLRSPFLFSLFDNEWVRSIKSEFKPIDPNKLRERNLLFQIEAAKSHGKLSQGAQEVWNAALQKKGKLLIAEKNVLFPGKLKKDLIDVAIEKVMAEGWDVEFVENGLLKNYERMVMIQG